MEIIVIPVIPWHKDLHKEVVSAIEALRPKYVLTDCGSSDEPDDLYQIPLSKFGLFSLRNYSTTIRDIEKKLGFETIELAPDYNEILEEVGEKAHVMEIIRFNMLLRKIQKAEWKTLRDFLRWLHKSFYKIDVMRGEAYAFSKKVKKMVKELESGPIVIVCDFLMLKALIETLGEDVKVYENFSSEDFNVAISVVFEG
ncbi:MAG: hypothetical protein DRN30_00500 [Thermoplasmata archaeon]|nr:MAG: hypothetical protein DRN30_00500 [Thermoplasmata archaeon]